MSELTKEQNRLLLIKIKEGDQAALAELIDANMGLVRSISQRFTASGVESDDLMQIGAMGMIKAARSFDFSFDTAFSTYAVPMIVGEIRRFLRDDGMIKVSRELKSRGARVMAIRERFISENGREPRLSELSSLSGLSVEEIAEAMDAASCVCSLSEPINGDEDGLTLEGSIPDRSGAMEELTDKLALAEAISSLPPLWREIVVMRYYKDMSQAETGKRLGLTQVKVSREEQKILSALRAALMA